MGVRIKTAGFEAIEKQIEAVIIIVVGDLGRRADADADIIGGRIEAAANKLAAAMPPTNTSSPVRFTLR